MDFSKIRNYLFLGLLAVVTVLFLYIIKPFAYPIFWAAILAVLFYPLYKKLNKKIKHPNLSALISLSLVTVIIILPLSVLGLLLTKEVVVIYNSASGGGQLNQLLHGAVETIKHNPYTAQFNVNEAFWTQKFAETSQAVIDYLFNFFTNLTQNSLTFAGLFVIMLYTLFFFFRDGQKILKKLMYLCPLGDKYEVMLYEKFTTAVTAVIKGLIIIGGVQATLGGVLFWTVGINGAIIWAIIMWLASLVPGFGVGLVWFPAGIVMLISGNIWQGITILLVGLLVISTIDNFIRPLIVGKDLRMPATLILFSTLGGIALFGISGFMLGPIVVALFMSFWEMYEEYYHKELSKN